MPSIITDPVLAAALRAELEHLTAKLGPQGIGVAMFMFRTADPQSPALFGTNIKRTQMLESVGRWVDAERAKALADES